MLINDKKETAKKNKKSRRWIIPAVAGSTFVILAVFLLVIGRYPFQVKALEQLVLVTNSGYQLPGGEIKVNIHRTREFH